MAGNFKGDDVRGFGAEDMIAGLPEGFLGDEMGLDVENKREDRHV
jgi:hypothetical protein